MISIQELTFQGLELMASTYLTFEVWITITGIYLLMALSLSLALRRLENHLREGRITAPRAPDAPRWRDF